MIADAFISALPLDRKPPRFGFDDDGDVYFEWPRDALTVTVEGQKLHALANAVSAPIHLGPFSFTGGCLPVELLQYIPKR
jgi:hypothetical protein